MIAVVKNNFPYPLDTEIIEEVPILKTKVDVDEKTNKPIYSRVYEMEQRKTIYFDPPKNKVACADGKHSWSCENIHSYTYSCANCPRKIRIDPIHFDVQGDQIISKLTGKPV